MSGTLSGSKSSSSGRFNNSTTDTLDPRLAGALYGNVDQVRSTDPYRPFTGPLVADFNEDQLTAQDRARTASGANIGGDTLSQAIASATQGAGYAPQPITTGGYEAFAPSSVGINRSAIRDVNYGGVDQAGIDRFMNPWTDSVVDASLSDLDRQRQIAQRDNAGYATKAGAFRGTQLFGLRDNTDDTFARAAGSTAANTRAAGFNTALGAAQNEVAQGMNAQALNQGQDASVATNNAQLQLQQALDMARRSDAAKQFGIGTKLSADTFNANQGADAANRSLVGAGVLSGLSGQQRDQAFGDIALLGGVGDAIQGNRQAGIDAALDEHRTDQGANVDWQQIINQSLGLIPQTGTRTSSGTESSKSKSIGASVTGSYGGK